MNKIFIVNVLLFFLPQFCTYFSLQILCFLLSAAQEYFLPQGAGYPIATSLWNLKIGIKWKSTAIEKHAALIKTG